MQDFSSRENLLFAKELWEEIFSWYFFKWKRVVWGKNPPSWIMKIKEKPFVNCKQSPLNQPVSHLDRWLIQISLVYSWILSSCWQRDLSTLTNRQWNSILSKKNMWNFSKFRPDSYLLLSTMLLNCLFFTIFLISMSNFHGYSWNWPPIFFIKCIKFALNFFQFMTWFWSFFNIFTIQFQMHSITPHQ